MKTCWKATISRRMRELPLPKSLCVNPRSETAGRDSVLAQTSGLETVVALMAIRKDSCSINFPRRRVFTQPRPKGDCGPGGKACRHGVSPSEATIDRCASDNDPAKRMNCVKLAGQLAPWPLTKLPAARGRRGKRVAVPQDCPFATVRNESRVRVMPGMHSQSFEPREIRTVTIDGDIGRRRRRLHCCHGCRFP